MKQGKGEQSFDKRTNWSQQTPSSSNTRDDSTHGNHQMVNTEIRLIIFFASKDGEALYSQQKQDRELTVAQIISSSQQNSGLNERKRGKLLGHQVQLKSISLGIYSGGHKQIQRIQSSKLCLKNCGQRSIILYSRQQTKPSQRKRNVRRQSGCLRRRYK